MSYAVINQGYASGRIRARSVAVRGVARAGSAAKIAHLAVTSAELAHGFADTNLLNAYGCSGGNLSPPLSWSGAPAGTKSFIVTLYDPDDRDSPSGWWHWVVYDIPASVSELAAGAGVEHSTKLPAGTHQGRTDLGTLAYHGPCPDKGDKPHAYTFTVYALGVAKLPVDEGFD
jgi:Raf kinase inhibitor-like YbhB/YbcL family protein